MCVSVWVRACVRVWVRYLCLWCLRFGVPCVYNIYIYMFVRVPTWVHQSAAGLAPDQGAVRPTRSKLANSTALGFGLSRPCSLPT